jgi:glycosyltransferase involved in cell wall biosynthesis
VHKNHIRAIKALEIFYMEEKGVLDVLILGPGMETLRNGSVNHPLIHIREMIQRIQENALLKQRCHIIGEVSDVKYSQYLAHAQFLWHPVLIDDGTFCAIEAAYLNIPCLSSDYPAMRFMNERFSLNLLFADPYDIKDMAKKLKRIENEAIERKTLLPSQIHLEQFSPDHLALEFWTNLKKWLP